MYGDSDYTGEAILPNPYGKGFDDPFTWTDGLSTRSKMREKTRLQWGNFIQNPMFTVWRNSGPILLSLLYLFPLFAGVIPTLMASESSTLDSVGSVIWLFIIALTLFAGTSKWTGLGKSE